jgi:hypothetical protein
MNISNSFPTKMGRSLIIFLYSINFRRIEHNIYFHSRGWLYLDDASGLYKPYYSKMMGLYSRIPPNPVSLLVFPFQTDVNLEKGYPPGDKPAVGNHRKLYPNYPQGINRHRYRINC